MLKIVQWQIGLEEKAAAFYRLAAARFAAEPGLAAFLQELAGEEEAHGEMLRKAADDAGLRLHPSPLLVDEETRARIEARVVRAHGALSAGEMDRRGLLATIVEIEFSEWNDLFLYIVSLLAGLGPDYQRAAAAVERHRRMIAEYLDQQSCGRECLADFRRLRSVWSPKILVVDDEATIRHLLKLVLGECGEVAAVANGREALAEVQKTHFDAIVCDMEMPVLDGMDFFLQAREFDAEIGERILFFTATTRPHYEDFFRREKLPLLPKPATITALLDAVRGRIDRRKEEAGRESGARREKPPVPVAEETTCVSREGDRKQR